jgi:hypothetical protein
VDTCAECLHWRHINFNQIGELRPSAFRHFAFAPNTTTNLVIYKLVNSSVAAGAFGGLRVPGHAHLEITFQYNSQVRLERGALDGLRLERNSTLVFNFPYTTQVPVFLVIVYLFKCTAGKRACSHHLFFELL